MDENPKIAKDFLNTVQLLGSRATFFAGFTYYQIGRYGFTCGTDTTYIVLNTLSFAMSVLAAAIAGFFSYYLESLTTGREKIEFCESVRFYVRGVFRLFLFASIFYLLGLGRMGWVYYFQTNMRFCPFIIMLISVILLIRGFFYIVASQLTLQTNSAGKAEWLIDHVEFVKKSPYSKRTGEKFETFVGKQSAVIAGRSIFIAGLAQNGIMRYMPCPAVFADNYYSANLFLFFVTVATAAAFLSGFILATVQVFLPDTDEDKQLAFAIYVAPVVKACFVGYVIAFLALGVSISLMGFGTNYTQHEWPTLLFGIIGTLAVVAGAWYAWSCKTQIEQTSNSKPPTTAVDNDDAQNVEDEDKIRQYMNRINIAGSMSTLAAGYLFYNIVTFDTDVLRQSFDVNLHHLTLGYLLANTITICLGLTAAVFDSILTLCANLLNTVRERAQFVHMTTTMSYCCVWFYKLSLIGWFVVFGLFGYVKFETHFSYIPLVYALLGIIVTFLGSQYISHVYKSVNNSPASATSLPPDRDRDMNGPEKRAQLLNGMAGRVLFLGGFAYYALDFFNFRVDRPYQYFYIHNMSICFMASIWVIYWSTDYNSKMGYCKTAEAKFEFARATYAFYIFVMILTFVVILSLLLGFAVLGDQKFIDNYAPYVPVIVFGSFLALAVIIFAFVCIVLEFRRIYNSVPSSSSGSRSSAAVEGGTGGPSSVSGDANNQAGFSVTRFNNQIGIAANSASFVAGNVCYEILFTEALSGMFPNYYYFTMATITFSWSVSAVAISTLISLLLGELKSQEQRHAFGLGIHRMQDLIFALSSGSLFTWISGCIALGDVKYGAAKDKLWEPSFFICSLGSVLVIYSFLVIQARATSPVLKALHDQSCAGTATSVTSAAPTTDNKDKGEDSGINFDVKNPMTSAAANEKA